MIAALTVLFGFVLIAFAFGTFSLMGNSISSSIRFWMVLPFWAPGITLMLMPFIA